ncbi:ABC transporter permease [Solicola gregarius]|uniref:ABC transporter permease n=1 Tax=Solicola gregarius TaxID=2908642 RepID=A0AA46TH31_9ACTN|nr:ABC transporter permease [Solicola gregarius]UYM05031.1 ABC transporter permease [Solicola gregarius]
MAAQAGSLPRYIVQRLLLIIPMVWILLTLVFLLMRVAPGDPVSASVGGRLSEAALDERRASLGLDRPLIVQYFDYLGSILRLDFGKTITDNQPILDVVKENGGATLTLTVSAMIIALVVGIPLGLLAGRLRDTTSDAVIRIFGIITYAAPVFYTGLLVQILFLNVFPGWPLLGDSDTMTTYNVPSKTHILLLDAIIAGDSTAVVDVLKHLMLPAVTLALLICGIFIRLTRVNVLQTLQADYVEAARARGIKESKVVRAHAFRNALVPVVTIVGLQVALLMSGAVLTEKTFAWPGLGNRLIDYIEGRDYIAVQGIISLFAIVVVVVSLVIDIINAMIDPRVRY